MLISILLCLALKSLRKLQKKISFIFANEKLLCAHQVCFISATILAWISIILDWAAEEQKKSYNENCKIENASDFFAILHTLDFFIINLLILYVFIKYGKPVEDDARTLIQKKLQAVYS